MSKKITPVILSGGAGTRLWPLSRKQKPKQFIKLAGGTTPFEQTYERIAGQKDFQSPLIICAKAHRFLVHELLEDRAGKIIMEPCARNTAPAIAVAAHEALERAPKALLLVMPSDHYIPDSAAFLSAVRTAAPAIEQGGYALFGIRPTSQHTGYGYIEQGAEKSPLYQIKSFKEKPDQKTAEKYLASGNYLWNSGIFLINAQTYLDDLKNFEPSIYDAAAKAWAEREDDLGDILLGEEAFKTSPSKSIDYAIMENTKHGYVLAANFGWSDLGSWDSLDAASTHDAQNNAIQGNVITLDAHNCYIRSEGPLISVSGVEGIIAVAMDDVVLITRKGSSENVGEIVKKLEQSKRPEAAESRIVYRPWGSYEITSEGPNYKTKRIIVKAGKRLSLQSHKHRSEHWVVVSGTASVTLDKKRVELAANESIYVPCGAVHRLENKKTEPLVLIEVQTGSYLGEDDIERYEDDFGRKA
jgi:mannose-1-phosphate guanylyltransferase/mannose-6-phosphate isomerase